ncbi:serine/threonine-protein kinase [Streptomyces albireticuli]|nr:serine/threonine-protein kinase [Streptomyces albireticuli]
MNVPGDMVDGRFELIARLGAGGMGTVWRARDTMLDREVALKAVRSDTAPSHDTRERVLREARALARLSHPHVVTIHHIVDTEPHPWIVMELVGGTSLQERLGTGPLSPAETARIGRQVLSALRAAHTAGIRHRDVKPANILLRADGTAVLTDFGIAALSGSTSLTATGELIGSPEYIAPERIRGQDDDPASDLWSLGLVLYVCGEGVSPLRRPTTLATLAAVLDDPVPPPVRSGPLAPVLQALLVRDPAARPDAARLDAMLAQAESGTAPQWARPTVTAPAPPAPAGPIPPVPTRRDGPRPAPASGNTRGRPRGRTAVVLALAAVLVIAATTALVLTLRGQGDDRVSAGASPSAAAPPAASAPPSPARQQNPTPRRTPDEEPATSAAPRPSVPAVTRDRWIAQLFSEPLGSGTAARDRRLAAVRRTVPEAIHLRSDDYASLRPGYWVIYAPGPFGDGRAALSFCDARGLTSANACIGRYLSLSADDFGLQCRPPASSPRGRCTRA